jgi:predicted nucleic acid-binding protein
MKLVVDTNIIISALLKDGFIRKIIINRQFKLLTPAYSLSEISKYKNEIMDRSGFNDQDFLHFIKILFKYIKIINPIKYEKNINQAKSIMVNIDIKDVPFIATALTFNAVIWSDDIHFKMQNKIKVYNTKEIFELGVK